MKGSHTVAYPGPNRFTGFHVMAKPTGPLCNLNCSYCFYLEKEKMYPGRSQWAMSDALLDSYIRQYIESQDTKEVGFSWQGGEPTILGVEFFERVVNLQQKYADGKRVWNTLQTNAVLLDDRWAQLLGENEFLVGVSIDGPQKLHDHYRRDKGGHPTFDRVLRGIDCLKNHGVEFNTLTCVQRNNARHPLDVYRFLKEAGSGHIQFIPIVERVREASEDEDLTLVSPESHHKARVAKWSVEPLQYGRFLAAVFDEWVRNDVGEVFFQIFEVTLQAWMGMARGLCVFSETCGNAVALEHNGDLYSCDHFVYPENHLGNILENSLASLACSEQQQQFGLNKRDALPKYCRECDVRFACNGECPKHRFIKTPDGEEGLNYLCEGYKHFFTHVDPYMRYMAKQLEQQRPATTVMAYARQFDLRASGKREPGPNDPCLCGSGRKYKKCCG